MNDFVIYRRIKPKIRLFCFPYAGGGASIYRKWPDLLSENIEICAVQPPGRENRISEEPVSNIHVLVQHILSSIENILDLPFALFGYSTGALVAFELARALREKKMPVPVFLFVAAARAPHIPEPFPLHDLPDDKFIEGLKRFSGTPDVVLQNREVMDFYMPLLRADLAIEETYRHISSSPLDIPIAAFYGSDDKEGGKEVVAPWEQYTSQTFSLHEITGGHFFLKTSVQSMMLIVSQKLRCIETAIEL